MCERAREDGNQRLHRRFCCVHVRESGTCDRSAVACADEPRTHLASADTCRHGFFLLWGTLSSSPSSIFKKITNSDRFNPSVRFRSMQSICSFTIDAIRLLDPDRCKPFARFRSVWLMPSVCSIPIDLLDAIHLLDFDRSGRSIHLFDSDPSGSCQLFVRFRSMQSVSLIPIDLVDAIRSFDFDPSSRSIRMFDSNRVNECNPFVRFRLMQSIRSISINPIDAIHPFDSDQCIDRIRFRVFCSRTLSTRICYQTYGYAPASFEPAVFQNPDVCPKGTWAWTWHMYRSPSDQVCTRSIFFTYSCTESSYVHCMWTLFP